MQYLLYLCRVNMAKTGEYCVIFKNRIIKLYFKGLSYRQIANRLEISFSSVRNIVKKYLTTGSVLNKPRPGRPTKFNEREQRSIHRIVERDPTASAAMIAQEVATTSNTTFCLQTVRNVIHKFNYYGRVQRRKPFISEVNRKKRLQFAKTYINEDLEFWKNVIFSDESKFNIFGSDGRKYVWRKPNTEFQARHVRPTVKHGGGSVLVWGCMSWNGTGNLTYIDNIMNAEKYVDILRHNLKSSAEKLGISDTYIFQQDNDPKHTANKTKEWMLYNVRSQLKTPPQSPDINPIEHLWYLLDQKVKKNKISSKSTLKEALGEEWRKIGQEVTQNLVSSMPRRLQAIIDADGMMTKY